MINSTNPNIFLPPLPKGWTEHKAPSGHSYYYNSVTKQSTYTRPAFPVCASGTLISIRPTENLLSHASESNPLRSDITRDEHSRNTLPNPQEDSRRDYIRSKVYRKQPTDRPISCHAIPGHDNWMLIHTKFGRRFVYNKNKKLSFWRIPEKLKSGILALDQIRILEKAKNLSKINQNAGKEEPHTDHNRPNATPSGLITHSKISDESEDEDIETTDSEAERDNSVPCQLSEEKKSDVPIEFGEDDIAFQLAAMSEEYGLEPDEYNDEDSFEFGTKNFDEKEAVLFEELLDDFKVNPYSPWEKVVEEERLVDDIRYTALSSTKLRKRIWEEWAKKKIAYLRQVRAKQERKDPRISYLNFLQKYATPKLYWPEFKRKYRKNEEMRETGMNDKECEKIYREYINRLKLPKATLKSDLLSLLKEQPLWSLNNATLLSNLPSEILTDLRFTSVDSISRESLIEAYISTLPPPSSLPDNREQENQEKMINNSSNLERRQKVLEDRVKHVAEEKRRQSKDLTFGKEILREEEEKIARAMNVGYEGINSYFLDTKTQDK